MAQVTRYLDGTPVPQHLRNLRFVPASITTQTRAEYRAPLPEVGTPGQSDYLQLGEWWTRPALVECGRGWVRDERFGSGQVIKGTNRNVSRKWREVGK